jgi:hypothetical protein
MRAHLVAVAVNWKLPAATVASIIEDCVARLVLCDPPRRPLCPPGIRCRVFGEDFAPLLDQRPFAGTVPHPAEPAMFCIEPAWVDSRARSKTRIASTLLRVTRGRYHSA